MKLYAQYSVTSYCSASPDPGSKLTCLKNACPDLAKNGVTAYKSFRGPKYGQRGSVAIDPTRKEVVLPFRGSASIQDAFVDLTINMLDCSRYAPGCKIHAGFQNSWADVKPILKPMVEEAMAIIGSADLRREGGIYKDAPQYGYGSPRVGNQALAEFIQNQNGPDYRITHFDDIATTVMPEIFGFRESFPEFYLAKGPAL
ncbi:hypothetical protein NLG97_g2493 [Lecanicillium saksenae]|uniref:Uncharacterized protein n=1 Tax=Lecanicillium saksenae TaxID=468837 RepID=A0ACC1R412_9HYPO|nr:hypothetical protein NLG97_g2493 [Lecanicillium saksenae]